MHKKIYYDLIPILIIIPMFAFTIGVYFHIFEIPFLYQYTTITGASLWRFDITSYLKNIDGAFNNLAELKLELNPLTWKTTSASFTSKQFWDTLLNNIAYMFNYLIFVLNTILFVFRFIAYLVVNILCILGMVRNPYTWTNPSTLITTIYQPNWLISVFTWISTNLQIPFIQP